MPRAKKDAAEAVEKVKAVAEDAKEAVKAAAETVAEKAEPVVEKVKTAAKTRRTAKKAAEDKPAKAPKATRAKKAADVETKVIIELPNVAESADSLVTRAKADWLAKGNAPEDMKQLTLYINAAEAMVYYVVNDDYLSGNFAI